MWLGGYWWLGVSAAAAAVLAAKGGKDKQRKTIKLSVRAFVRAWHLALSCFDDYFCRSIFVEELAVV